MRNLEILPKSKLLIAAALAGVMMASCSQKPESANEVATQQLIEATQKAEEAAIRAEAAQKALETAEAEKRLAEEKAMADSEQAAAAAKLKSAQDRAHAAEHDAAAAKKRAAAAERQVAATSASGNSSSTYTQARPVSTPAPAPVCQDCGTISSITAIKVKGKGTGMGAVAGAIAGIAAGNQVGDGKGTDVAKVVGAIGGAYAGNQAEKYIRADTVFDVMVRMDNGTTRTVRVADASSVSSGTRVRVSGANLERL